MPGLLSDLISIIGRWLYLEDQEGVEIILATALASQFPGDPLWLFIIGPPGSSKTEICRAFHNSPRIYSTDTLTPKSLLSGFRSKKNTDLLPQLQGKLLVIKDFTAMLSRPPWETSELFGTLRGIYDGYYEATFGSGVGRKRADARFGILAAVTPAIEKYGKVQSLLGERFLYLRSRYSRKLSVRSAIKHSGQEEQMRQEISQAMMLALEFYSSLQQPKEFDQQENTAIAQLANIVSLLRTGVERDYRHNVVVVPEAEVGTRLAKQLIRLAQCLCITGSYKYSHLIRVATDTIPKERLAFVRQMAQGAITHTAIASSERLARHLVERAGEDLWLLGAVDKVKGSNEWVYSFMPDFEVDLTGSKLVSSA